jgi:hypothetical protein
MGELGKGTTLKDSASNVIGLITTFGGFGNSSDVLDKTTHDISGNFYAYMAGLRKGKPVTLTCDLSGNDTSGQIACIADCLAGTEDTYTITLPNNEASTYIFRGFVSSWDVVPNLKSQITLALTFQPTGSTAYPGPYWTT